MTSRAAVAAYTNPIVPASQANAICYNDLLCRGPVRIQTVGKSSWSNGSLSPSHFEGGARSGPDYRFAYLQYFTQWMLSFPLSLHLCFMWESAPSLLRGILMTTKPGGPYKEFLIQYFWILSLCFTEKRLNPGAKPKPVARRKSPKLQLLRP